MSVVVVSGHPRPGSRTLKLATEVGRALSPDAAPDLVDVAAPRADAVDVIRGASLLVVATPTYKGAYTGVLKVMFDEFPHQGLKGVAAAPVVTAGILSQAEAAEGHLRALLLELAADPVHPALLATEPQLADAGALVAAYAEALLG